MNTTAELKPGEYTTKKVKDLKAGEYFRRKNRKGTYIFGYAHRDWTFHRDYDRSTKRYTCSNVNDVFSSVIGLKGDEEVIVDFTY